MSMSLPSPSVSGTSPLSLGRYPVSGRAGTGSACAFRARDPGTGALVAVYLYPKRADGRLLDQLATAFEACAAIDHPNVLRVLDFGPEASNGYLATEWVEGTTLARLLEMHGRLPEANVIRFAAQIGQALDHTRDGATAICRPQSTSVLVRNDGVAKLIPFTLPDDGPSTPGVSAVVKPQFAAALAGKGIFGRVHFAEAVFSLGTLIHEALTGVPWAPPEEPPARIGSRRRRPPPRLLGLTDRTERAIRRATDPDPTKRPATCADLMKILRGRSKAAGTPKTDARSGAGEDRRGCVRYAIGVGSKGTISTSVFDAPGEPSSPEVWPLVVLDVSATGIGILLARRCEPGTELMLEVASGTNREVRGLPARVVRVRKDNYGHWTHGCAFLEPLTEPELAALMEHLGRDDM